MFNLSNLFSKNESPAKKISLDRDSVAELLKVNPEALEAFEKAYQKESIPFDLNDDNFFHVNSRQASEASFSKEIPESLDEDGQKDLSEMKDRIVKELLAQTKVYVFDGRMDKVDAPKALPGDVAHVSASEIDHFPAAFRPQLAGDLMSRDINDDSYASLLYFYKRAGDPKEKPETRQYCYHMFRQGLDILDLDPITYEILGMNKNSMGYWLPALVAACRRTEDCAFRIPATRIAKVPLTLLQLTRKDYELLTRTTLDIVDAWAYEAFQLDETKDYFIKTGTYSSKFDFRNARVHEPKEVQEIGEYLLFIHNQTCCMASPTVKPAPIYGMSTTNEWVVREFIPDAGKNPTIYHGLPLRTEFRVFIDCDTDTVLGAVPYWEPDTMKNRFSQGSDASSPHQMHDYVIYKAHEEKLMQRYQEQLPRVLSGIEAIVPKIDLAGQWSVDVMLNGDDLWLIDMALAENSFFYSTVVPAELRRPSPENWIPQLPEA